MPLWVAVGFTIVGAIGAFDIGGIMTKGHERNKRNALWGRRAYESGDLLKMNRIGGFLFLLVGFFMVVFDLVKYVSARLR